MVQRGHGLPPPIRLQNPTSVDAMFNQRAILTVLAWIVCGQTNTSWAEVQSAQEADFYERRIRPILVEHCYECHSEQAQEQQGGLLLDRRAGWLKGGDSDKAVVPGDADASLLIKLVSSTDEDMRMPPEAPLADEQIRLLQAWIRRGAPGPREDLGETEFSQLGDQDYLSALAADHWAFRPIRAPHPPDDVENRRWSHNAIDRFVYSRLATAELTPSRLADARTLIRRLSYDLTGLPPSRSDVVQFIKAAESDSGRAIGDLIDRLLDSSAYGEHFGRMWLDVARYADTDSFYRPDTKTPHYFPFAFTYRDYVIDAFNSDKPYDHFVREQLAADLLGVGEDAPEIAALGFLAVGPHANRNQAEAIDDWIDVTTRGLMGATVACARCHDHKYEPIPTADYYALHGIFASVVRPSPLDETSLPQLTQYASNDSEKADYAKQRAAIDAKLKKAGDKKSGGNNRSITQKIRETELAELLAFHPGAPVHTMIVKERSKPIVPVIFIRGDAKNRGESVPRRFLRILDPAGDPFPDNNSGRLRLAEKITDANNPLTPRVIVNRIWGAVMGSYLVDTPSDFGLQGSPPTHPELLDWLAADFVSNGWSIKHLVRTIVSSQIYQQSSAHRAEMAAKDAQNVLLWRANRKHLSIEAIRDSMLAVSGGLDRAGGGRPGQLWGDNYTDRRAIYGFINRFNLDPTLRAFDFPTPMQTQTGRSESIVAPQTLFTMNAPFVIDQAIRLTDTTMFLACKNDSERVSHLFEAVLQRQPHEPERVRVLRFVESQKRFFSERENRTQIKSAWPLVAQSLLMSNEFQYVD